MKTNASESNILIVQLKISIRQVNDTSNVSESLDDVCPNNSISLMTGILEQNGDIYKDTFPISINPNIKKCHNLNVGVDILDTAKQYVNGVKTLWQSDSLMCGDSLPSEASGKPSKPVTVGQLLLTQVS